ncbi:MAG: phage major capsid protein [Eubacterium sp.]|nr:phage major capsid protein [Eubacterium sp.]
MAFDNIKLEKGLYTTGKSFTQALDELDPSENYRGSSLEGLDAYERQLKRFDIKVSGANSDPVSKFFATTDSAALFPEYVSRAVRLGVDSNNKVERIVATTTEIDSMDYRSISISNPKSDFELSEVSEGEEIPELTINLNKKLTTLQKHGKMLKASYEAIKFQRLDLFTTVLKHIGTCISNSEFNQAFTTICNDENLRKVPLTSGSISFVDIINAWAGAQPYQMTTMIVGQATLGSLLQMEEFRDAITDFGTYTTGNMATPFGAEVFLKPTMPDNCVLTLDKNYAVEKVQAGGILTEFDKLIDRQLECATISTIVGFSTIYGDAAALVGNLD